MPKQFNDFFNHFDYASLLQNAIRIAIIIAVAVAIWLFIRFVIARIEQRIIHRAQEKGENAAAATNRATTLTSLASKLIGAFYWGAVALTLLSQIGVNIGALVAGAGIFGLALSFGAQNLVQNYISGFFMISENQISVGDVAVIDGEWGTIESINFRTTILRNMDGSTHVFSNGSIKTLANHSRDWGGYVFKIRIAYKENLKRVVEIIKRVGEEMKQDESVSSVMIADVEIHGVVELGESGYVLRGRLKTKPDFQWSTERAFLARVKDAFQQEDIELPFPHRTLYFGKEGAPFRPIEQARKIPEQEQLAIPDKTK
jgi:small conductance mechanosensitive channel